jgi:N-acetylmuramoyl-L-alanine amidase
MLEWLESEYPTSALLNRVSRLRKSFGTTSTAPSQRALAVEPHQIRKSPSRPDLATIQNITRSKIGEVIRITVEMDTEVQYLEERLEAPARIFFDLKGAKPVPGLINSQLIYNDYAAVPEIRLGQHVGNTTRIVIDMAGISRYTVFSVYDPFRLVIDCVLDPERPKTIVANQKVTPIEKNPGGDISLARQLGLGISRIVIDPGHGGHDPGAIGRGAVESEIALDVALRLNELLMTKPGFEVIMTRRTDRFVPLKERTAIANRENADLFLSIHANASLKPQAGGIETYYLNFTTDPEAEAVAARENSASGQAMRNLTDIVQTIALNNKLDESRDFAQMVQNSMFHRLRPQHNQLRNLGVKQAPFVVLIGAKMPSVLAEISFVTNEIESSLLQTDTYRQRAAQALLDAILIYRDSLQKNLETTETF